MQVLIRAGQIWWARVPYTDTDIGKVRPVVILGWSPFTDGDDHNVVVLPVFSWDGDISKRRGGDYRPVDWRTAGLSEESHVRCRRVMTIAPNQFEWGRKIIGSLSDADYKHLTDEVALLFNTGPIAAVPGS